MVQRMLGIVLNAQNVHHHPPATGQRQVAKYFFINKAFVSFHKDALTQFRPIGYDIDNEIFKFNS
jgi:hypothetical protein